MEQRINEDVFVTPVKNDVSLQPTLPSADSSHLLILDSFQIGTTGNNHRGTDQESKEELW